MASSTEAIDALPVDDAFPRAEPFALADRAHRLELTLSQVWVAAVVLVPLTALLQSRLWMIDLAYHVRAGEIMLRTHAVLRTDPFSFASGVRWMDQQWLAQIVFAATFRLGGWFALELLRAGLGVLVAVLVFSVCRRRGAERKPAALLAIGAAILAFPGLILRPQLFGIALFAVVQWILVVRDRRPWVLLSLPVVFGLWANVHGSFPLGLGLIGLAIVEEIEARRSVVRLLVALAGCVLATLANPWGLGVWRYVIDVSTNGRIASWVQEWQPPTIRTLLGAAFFVSVAAVLMMLGRSRARLRWSRLLGLAAFFALALSSLRGIYWWALVAAPAVAGLVPSASKPELERRSWINTGAVTVVVLAIAAFLMPWVSAPGSMLLDAPRSIAARLASVMEPGDRVLAAQRWGSWFEYALPPRSVFVDSRIELYPEDVWNDYTLVARGGSGWTRVLDDRRIDFVVIQPSQQARLLKAISTDTTWRLLYRADGGALFGRAV